MHLVCKVAVKPSARSFEDGPIPRELILPSGLLPFRVNGRRKPWNLAGYPLCDATDPDEPESELIKKACFSRGRRALLTIVLLAKTLQ